MSRPHSLAGGPRPALLHEGYAAEVSLARQLLLAPEKLAVLPLEKEGRRDYKPYGFQDGIAIIGVYGYLTDRTPWWGSRYMTGYDALRWQLATALEDDDVLGIVLDVDSYGGLVTGCFDLVDWIMAAKKAAGKPIVSILSECAYSAAYAIACAADSISVPRTGGVGSIGVITMHVDMSGALDRWGEKITLITHGDHKGDGNPYGPLPDDVRDAMQKEIASIGRLFEATVARNRQAAGAKLTAEQVAAFQARTFDGPDGVAEAVRLGLADAVASPADAFQAFATSLAE